MAKVANLKSNIQSTIQQSINEKQKQIAASSAATKSGSTETPTVTETPKVTPTAKSVQSIPKVSITPVSITSTPTNTTNTTSVPDLLSAKTTPALRKAETPDLLSKQTEKKDIMKTAVPLNLVKAADTHWWMVKQTVDKTLIQQFSDWFNETPEKVTNAVWSFFKKPAENLWVWAMTLINDTEYYTAKLADVIETSLWGKWGFTEAFQQQQWAFWDTYWKQYEIESSRAYDENATAQNVTKNVSEWLLDKTWNEALSNMVWNVAWHVTATFSDPNQIAYTVWYMLPALVMMQATWWWFLANTAIWLPSQSADVYKDFAEDPELASQFTDNQLFWISTWVWTLLAMVETFWDALWDMPWAKAMSRDIRKVFTKSFKKEISTTLSKEFMNTVDKSLIKDFKKPITNALKKWFRWGFWEWMEEMIQDTIQTESAIALGSKREWMTLERLLTTGITAWLMWLIIETPWAAINIKNNTDLNEQYNEYSKALDEIAPWINEETKEAFFSAMITSQQNDAKLSEKRVEKYESQVTQLYNQISQLEQQLETTTDENAKTQINNQIEWINNQIKEIDSKINQWRNTEAEINQYIEEYNQQREEDELEELHKEVNMQMPKEVGGENLSTQTMKEIKQDEIEVESPEELKVPNTSEWYESLYNALNEPQNTLLKNMSYEELLKLKNDLQPKFREALMNYDYKDSDNLRFIIRRLNEEISAKKWEYQGSLVKKLKFKNARDYVQQMINIDKKNWDWSSSRDRTLRERYMSQFLRTNLEWDFAAHMPWLKWVNLKQIEKSLTEEKIKEIAEMLSWVSVTFWIDFNKVITDKSLSMNIVDNIKDFTYNTDALGQMTWNPTKEQVMDLMKRTWERVTIWQEILKTWVIVALEEWPAKAASTMAHELWHLIDLAISTEEWLPLYFNKNKIAYTSIIKDDYDWKTFRKWQDRPWTKNYDYYNSRTEILARYAEQYFAYKNVPQVFDEFANRPRYWTTEEFEKLLPKFESLIQERLWAKLLDEQNLFYNEIVRRINENKFQTTSIEFSKWEVSENEVKQRMEQMKEEYTWIMNAIEWMKWDLKEEMEAYVQLSNLQSNYEMAMKKGFEYLDMQKTKQEQQEWIDDITVAVVPDPPQNPWTIENWLPMLWWSNIENWIADIIQWKSPDPAFLKTYMNEQDKIKIKNRKKKFIWFFKELHQVVKDVFTPAITRAYNISPRVAWRLITMETQKDINIHRYRKQAEWFVKTLWSLKWKQALEVKMALLDYWALASEQGENIEQYKKDEVAKLKEVLLRNWFKEKDINDMFNVLDNIGKQYKDAGLSIVLTDMYFPRVVKDYEWLIDYMNRVSWNDIKVNKTSLMIRIRQIQADPKLSDGEKEARIRRAISMEYKQPWTTSQHWKERKMWKLSDWWPWIYAYYESPIESIDHYITSMVNAIERQLFLWWLKEDANLDADIINQDTAESVSQIIWKLVENWQVSEDDVAELQKSIMSVLNKKPSPKSVTAIKDITYITTITNFISAANQLDDLWMVILKDKSWLKHIVKAIFWMADIKYDDLWLEDAYEMFREEWGVTNWLFKKSFFNAFDRLWKTSFINAAWESMMHQAKNPKTRQYLYSRLQAMYWTESADRMMEKIDSWNYNDETGQIDIEILRDLLYQLWSTQPLYTSAMPTTYLNHPWARLCYALSSFTLKRIDWLLQWTKEVYEKNWWWAKWVTAAWAWVMAVSSFLAMFWAAIGDIWDFLKWKKDETFLWNFINEWIEEALAAWFSDAADSWLKIWDLSEYDLKTYKQQWMKWLLASKISPFIFDLGKDVKEAIFEHDKDEITDLSKYIPIFWKLLYYNLWADIWKSTGVSENWLIRRKDDWLVRRDEKELVRRKEDGLIRRK